MERDERTNGTSKSVQRFVEHSRVSIFLVVVIRLDD